MKKETRKRILQRLTARIETGLSYLEFNYPLNNSSPDLAWIRNIYILLSFYSELLLKSIYICERKHTNVKDLDNYLRSKLSHKLDYIYTSIGPIASNKYGIKSVKKLKNKDYKVLTKFGVFYVKDFINIRYDFLTPKVRKLKSNENGKLKTQIDILYKINSQLKKYAWEKN